MNDKDIYSVEITRCRIPSSTNYETIFSATSPTLEGISDMVNDFLELSEKEGQP